MMKTGKKSLGTGSSSPSCQESERYTFDLGCPQGDTFEIKTNDYMVISGAIGETLNSTEEELINLAR